MVVGGGQMKFAPVFLLLGKFSNFKSVGMVK
jgi:hypothetical protein